MTTPIIRWIVAASLAIALTACAGGDSSADVESAGSTPATTGAAAREDADHGHDEEHADEHAEMSSPDDLPAELDPFRISITAAGTSADRAGTHRVQRGGTAALLLTAEVSGELHLHGVDRTWQVRIGEQATTFAVESAGRFPLEFHAEGDHDASVVGYLEVLP